MTLDLTDEEAAALAKHLRQALDYARYPLAPRLDPLKAILAKLDPPPPQPDPLAPIKADMTPRRKVAARPRWKSSGPPMTLIVASSRGLNAL